MTMLKSLRYDCEYLIRSQLLSWKNVGFRAKLHIIQVAYSKSAKGQSILSTLRPLVPVTAGTYLSPLSQQYYITVPP
eukprot:jgi/Botrbrau1/20740/Bobra.0058s0068.1